MRPSRSSRISKSKVFLTLSVCLAINSISHAQPNRCVLIVIEDLRPEFVTRAEMPNLSSLARKGVSLSSHHAVYPAIPIVNAVSILRGSYPRTHGIVDNTVDFPAARLKAKYPNRVISASMPNLSRALYAARPQSQITSIIDRNAWVVDNYFTDKYKPPYITLWFVGRDKKDEIGSTEHLRILNEIDALIGTIIKEHKKRKMDVNLFITSSGSTLTPIGEPHSLADLLIQHGLKSSHSSEDVIIKNNQISVENQDLRKIREVVALLQKTSWIGAVYTQQIRVTHPEGKAKGALSFQSVYINHETSPDILVEPAWTDAPNAHGIPGTKSRIGEGESGTSSPYTLRIPFIAFGPDIKRKLKSNVPSANLDLSSTIHHIVGYTIPDSMDGRILHEILVGGPDPEDVKVLRRRHGAEVELEGLRYKLMMTEYSVEGVDYFDSTRTERFLKD